MTTLTCSTARDRVMELAWTLGAIEEPDDLVTAAMRGALGLLGGDSAGYNDVALSHLRVTATTDPDTPRSAQARTVLAEVIGEHPVVRHLASTPSTTPFRMSDLLPPASFHRTRVYETMFRPRGLEHQIVIPLRVDPASASGSAYVVNRGDRDFDDDALLLAWSMGPLLGALHAAMAARRPTTEDRDTARRRAGLTERELDVLVLMADGMTAASIGRARCISDRTVRKHLENAYAKLGVHDRLQAVEYCRRHRLIPAGALRTART